MVIIELQFKIAAFGNVYTVLQGFRQVLKQFCHLLRRFQVLFPAVEARAFGIIKRISVVDTHPGFMGVKIIRRQKPYVIGCDHGDTQLPCQPHGFLNINVFSLATGSLQFQVKPVRE